MKELLKIIELCPFLLPINTRFLVFRKLIRQEHHEYDHGDRSITVNRGREFEDAMTQLYQRNIKTSFHIRFINQFGKEEMGMDAGGLTKEFLTRLFKYSPLHAELPSTRRASGSSRTTVKSSCPIPTSGGWRKATWLGSTSSSDGCWASHCGRTSCWG